MCTIHAIAMMVIWPHLVIVMMVMMVMMVMTITMVIAIMVIWPHLVIVDGRDVLQSCLQVCN